jgi:hypothetical protein
MTWLVSVLLISGSLALAPTAVMAHPACPDAFPTVDAVEGVSGVGYTVAHGEEPTPFRATLIGRITDGIAPGVDMIMAELDSPDIAKAGVWAGMSGSPVYTEDGRLIGAVAYGLARSSPIAGITPAEEMMRLLGAAKSGPSAPVVADKVLVSKSVAKRLAATGKVTAVEASAGFQRIPLPVMVSGLSAINEARGRALLDAIERDIPNSRALLGGAAANGGNDTPSAIVAGGNFAAAISYGDVTAAGVGTTTFVCGDQAVAFGHPFLFRARPSMSVHSASALFVQPDPVFGSFKVANIGGVVGSLEEDRLAGIRGRLGVAPTGTAWIKSTLRATGGATRTGITRVVHPDFFPIVSGIHTFVNVLRLFDTYTPGSAAINIRIRGARANGKTFVLSRTGNFADKNDIASAVAGPVMDLIGTIVSNRFEKVRVSSLKVEGTVDPTLRLYQVRSVKVRQGGKYVVPTGPVEAKAGSSLQVRVALDPAPESGGASKTVNLTVPIPKGMAGYTDLNIVAGRYSDINEEITSFPRLLAHLRDQPGAASVRAVLTIRDEDGDYAGNNTATAAVDQVVEDYSFYIAVNVI